MCECVCGETSLLFRQLVCEPNQFLSHDNYSLFSSAPAADANRLPQPDLPLVELFPFPPDADSCTFPHIGHLKHNMSEGLQKKLSEASVESRVFLSWNEWKWAADFSVLFSPVEEVPAAHFYAKACQHPCRRGERHHLPLRECACVHVCLCGCIPAGDPVQIWTCSSYISCCDICFVGFGFYGFCFSSLQV